MTAQPLYTPLDGSTLVEAYENGTQVRTRDGAFLVYSPTGNLAGASRLLSTALAAAEGLSRLAAS